MRNRPLAKFSVGAMLVATTAVATITMAAPAGAAARSTSYNNATVEIRGGNGAAFAACVNIAKVAARHNRHYVPQSNYCRNVARANGGTVVVDNVSIFVEQHGSRRSHNNAQIILSGGDAQAVAACVNYLQGTATPAQVNSCSNTAVARGGDVIVRNSDITVIQT